MRTVRRLGGTRSEPIDVWMIAATRAHRIATASEPASYGWTVPGGTWVDLAVLAYGWAKFPVLADDANGALCVEKAAKLLPANWPDWQLRSELEAVPPELALDLDERVVVLHGGTRLGFDGLLVATGARPRHLPDMADLDGVHVLRTLEDCLSLRRAFDKGARMLGLGYPGGAALER